LSGFKAYMTESYVPSPPASTKYLAANDDYSISKQIDDYVTKDYEKRIARGDLINNPCTVTETKAIVGHGGFISVPYIGSQVRYLTDAVTAWSRGIGGVSGNLEINPKFEDLSDQTTRAISIAKFKAIARMDPTPFEFLEDIGEVKETIKFLAQPMKSLRKLAKTASRDAKRLRYARKGRRYNPTTQRGRYALDMLGDSSDSWLEFRFAASPLLRSMSDAVSATFYQNNVTKHPKRKIARASQTILRETNSDPVFNAYPHVFTYRHEYKRKYQVRTGILYEISNPVEDSRHLLGVRFKDIPETAWALVPLSFMVDRVVDISSAIRGVTNLADPDLTILAAWVTQKDNGTIQVQLTDYQDLWPAPTAMLASTDLFTNGLYKRDVWTPGYVDTVPQFDLSGLVKDAETLADLGTLIVSNILSV